VPINLDVHTVDEPRRFLATERAMGLVSPQAKVGDLIVGFWMCRIAAVMRLEEEGVMRVVGMVDVAFQYDEKDTTCTWDFYGDWRDIAKDMIMNINMDMDTLQMLSS
jgi:hypothetical protein